jgi:hypothetical protein
MTPDVSVRSDVRAPAAKRGRSFVDTRQRFIALFATEKAWAYAMACFALIGFGFAALEGVQILDLEQLLAQRQVVIVGETTAKQLVPLWPNGVGSTVCDTTCVEGSLESWISAFRFISGEQDGAQVDQHQAQAKTAAFVSSGSPAATIINQYYQTYPPYALAAKGLRLDVADVHVDVDHQQPNRYSAVWYDVVTDVRNHHVVGRHKFGAEIDVAVSPAARTEQAIAFNPGGVFVTDLHLWGEQ